MKKVIVTIAVLVGISTFGFSSSGEATNTKETSIDLVANNDLKFKLAFDNVKERASLIIKDQFGQVLYSATLPKSDKYSKIFDLSGLLDGSYSFVINNGGEITVKPFEIATETKRLVTALK